MKEWAAVAAKPGTPEEKVAAVVDASGDPDLAMHQHLATSAASASAWPAAVDYEAEVEPVALQGNKSLIGSKSNSYDQEART